MKISTNLSKASSPPSFSHPSSLATPSPLTAHDAFDKFVDKFISSGPVASSSDGVANDDGCENEDRRTIKIGITS